MAVILIPCKNLDHGKSRLSSHIGPSARRDLCELFLRQTLGLATSVVASRQVILVTSDPVAVEISREYGTSALVERSTGLNSALSDARDVLLGEGTVGPDVLVLPIDLPLANADALSRVMDAEADVVLAPDEERVGTNLLLIKSRALPMFPFAYGHESYRAHRQAARMAGLSFESFDDDHLAFDVDRQVQFMRWQAIRAQQACPIKLATPQLSALDFPKA